MFVCAAHKSLNLQKFNRLYAFPTVPDLAGDNMVILDSGAFALSKSGKKMNADYMQRLADHYRHYQTRDNVFCIAPDVFKNSFLSVRQYQNFIADFADVPVCPVVQFKSSTIDLFSTKKQIDSYAQMRQSRFVAISNNAFCPLKQHKELSYITDYIRRRFGSVWVHVLGAGYSHNNVKDWLKTGVNSIDSISYYTDAQHNMRWLAHSYNHEISQLDFKTLAIENARVANT